MTENDKKHIDNFTKEFKSLLLKYNAVYKSTGFTSTSSTPEISFMGVPDGNGDFSLKALLYTLPDKISPHESQ
jgi:hypothetical protein